MQNRKLLLKSWVLGLFCTGFIGLNTAPGFTTPNYQDLSTSHWAYEAIGTLAEKYGVELGYPDQTFRGEERPNRYQMAVLLLKILQTVEQKQLGTDDEALLARLKQELAPELTERLQYVEDQVDLQIGINEDLGLRLGRLQESLDFRLFGSLALRYCAMTTHLDQPQNILGSNLLGNNFQLRAGFGFNGRALDDFDYQVRFLTTDNQSYNLSWFPFGGNHIPRGLIALDRYFIRYRPRQLPFQTELSFGKAPDFFAESEALLDEDVSFTGLAQMLRWQDLMPGWKSLELGLAQKGLLVEETQMTAGMLGAKMAADISPMTGLDLRLGSSYLHYLGTDNLAKYNFTQGYQGGWSLRNRGAENQNYLSDFRLVDGFLKLRYQGDLPFALTGFADYVRNLGAQDKNQGFFIGAGLGERQKSGDWDFRYIYRHLEQDYNLALLTDETMAGTDVAGHVFNLGTLLGQKTHLDFTLHLRHSLSQKDIDTLYIFYTTLRQDF